MDQGFTEDKLGCNFQMVLCDLYNRMTTIFMIPQSTVQVIIDSFLAISVKASELRQCTLRRKLKCEDLLDSKIDQIVEVLNDDPFTVAQENLSTQYKRDKYLEENFKFVKPTEVVLDPEEVKHGSKKESYQYVSLKESMQLLTEANAMETRNRIEPDDSDLLSDIKDGNLRKNLPYFRDNPEAYTCVFYSDAIEINNPLSAARGRDKLIQL